MAAASGPRPVGEGGIERIFEARYPEPGGFDGYGFTWAGTTPQDVQAEAEKRGWRIVSRVTMVELLRQAGYQVCNNRAFGHVLYLDEADDLT